MAKSFDTYAPLGPFLVTPDELANPDDLEIACRVDGEVVQSSRTSDLIFPVPELIAWISRICTLEAGDLIYTGTPSGVGDSRQPPRYLVPGNVVETEVEGVGVMRNPVVAGPDYACPPAPARSTGPVAAAAARSATCGTRHEPVRDRGSASGNDRPPTRSGRS